MILAQSRIINKKNGRGVFGLGDPTRALLVGLKQLYFLTNLESENVFYLFKNLVSRHHKGSPGWSKTVIFLYFIGLIVFWV